MVGEDVGVCVYCGTDGYCAADCICYAEVEVLDVVSCVVMIEGWSIVTRMCKKWTGLGWSFG